MGLITDTITVNGQAAAVSTVASPTGISGATGAAVMLGLAGALTPNASGKMVVIITGSVVVGTSGDGATIGLRYGTGGAPLNNASVTGTAIGTTVSFINASSTTEKVPFALAGVVTGLTLNTALWLDLSVQNITGGTATITACSVTAFEI